MLLLFHRRLAWPFAGWAIIIFSRAPTFKPAYDSPKRFTANNSARTCTFPKYVTALLSPSWCLISHLIAKCVARQRKRHEGNYRRRKKWGSVGGKEEEMKNWWICTYLNLTWQKGITVITVDDLRYSSMRIGREIENESRTIPNTNHKKYIKGGLGQWYQ